MTAPGTGGVGAGTVGSGQFLLFKAQALIEHAVEMGKKLNFPIGHTRKPRKIHWNGRQSADRA